MTEHVDTERLDFLLQFMEPASVLENAYSCSDEAVAGMVVDQHELTKAFLRGAAPVGSDMLTILDYAIKAQEAKDD